MLMSSAFSPHLRDLKSITSTDVSHSDMEALIASLQRKLDAAERARDAAEHDATQLRERAQRAELAWARESRATQALVKRVAELEAEREAKWMTPSRD